MNSTVDIPPVQEMDAEAFDVIIIGAGLSGIGAAVRLQRDCPDRDFILLERREAIGGIATKIMMLPCWANQKPSLKPKKLISSRSFTKIIPKPNEARNHKNIRIETICIFFFQYRSTFLLESFMTLHLISLTCARQLLLMQKKA